MKDTNKKPVWLWLVLCLPLVFIVYFAISLSEGNIDPDSVKTINVTTPSGESFVFDKGDDIPFYVDMYLEADPLSKPLRDIENEKPLSVVIKQKNVETVFELFAEANTNGCFFRNKDGAYYSVPQSFAKQLLQRKECEYVYANAGDTLPTLIFKTGDSEQVILPKEYEWQYKDIAGNAVVDTQTKTASESQFFSFYSDVGFALSFSKTPQEHPISFYDMNGNALNISDPSSLLFTTDTKLRAVINVKWDRKGDTLGGTATYEFELLYDVLPELIRSNDTVKAGDVICIGFRHFSENEKITLSTQLITSDIKVNYGADGSAFAFIPVSAENTAGEYTLVFTVGSIEKAITLNVTAGDSAFNTATMDPEKYTHYLNPEYRQRFEELVKSWDDAAADEPMFAQSNSFSKPTDGELWFDFGTELNVNGQPDAYVVNGIDYRLEEGDSIKATQRGVVIYAGNDEVYGNMLVIDHGYGVRSHYYGLGTLGKQAGDTVQEGEIIGSAGVSGLVYTENSAKVATLHFAVSLNGVYINPNTLFAEGLTIVG